MGMILTLEPVKAYCWNWSRIDFGYADVVGLIMIIIIIIFRSIRPIKQDSVSLLCTNKNSKTLVGGKRCKDEKSIPSMKRELISSVSRANANKQKKNNEKKNEPSTTIKSEVPASILTADDDSLDGTTNPCFALPVFGKMAKHFSTKRTDSFVSNVSKTIEIVGDERSSKIVGPLENSNAKNDDKDGQSNESTTVFFESSELAEAAQWLEDILPESTIEERKRFLEAKQGDTGLAASSLEAYLNWRIQHQEIEKKLFPADARNSGNEDLEDWNRAASIACAARNEQEGLALARIARTYRLGDDDTEEVCDREGFRIIHILPGQMDDRIADLQTYSLAITLYLDRKLCRRSLEQITLVVDGRGGQGWRNNHAIKLLPFIKSTCRSLISLFPNRLARSIIYPLPPALGWVWAIVRKCLNRDVAERVTPLTGPATIISPPPYDQMCKHMEWRTAKMLEDERKSLFRPNACR